MIKVPRVGHVTFSVKDPSKSAGFYIDDWGLGLTGEAGGSIYLRTAAPEHHALRLTPGRESGFHELGLRTATEADLDRGMDELAAAGAPIEKAAGPADRPGARRNMRFRDPDGNKTPDIDRAHAFYRDHFGFKESDWNGHHMVFMEISRGV